MRPSRMRTAPVQVAQGQVEHFCLAGAGHKRPCLGRCGKLVSTSRCAHCAQMVNQQRRQERTVTCESWWRAWRTWFIERLVVLGIVPCCGAVMPGGPSAKALLLSECAAQSLIVGASSGGGLHLHHEPELTDQEAQDRAAVCDELRIVLLCDRCQNRSLQRFQQVEREVS